MPPERDHAAVILPALTRAARVHVEGSCHGGHCGVRQVTLWVKDHDHDLRTHLTAGAGLVCPVCQSPLTIAAVRTGAEQDAHDQREARRSVNAQIAAQQNGGFVDVVEFTNDALPPVAGTRA